MMGMGRIHLISLLCLGIIYFAEASSKDGRMISFFNVVKFKNDVCVGGSNRNGTCYTAEECSDRGGTSSGSCAEGFGVCCVIQLSCGQQTSENCTYLVQSATTSPTETNCQYKICPINKNICRIRFDFTMFSITGPYGGNQPTTGQAQGNAIGDCTTDTFSVATGVGSGTPIICGTNNNQHVIVDTDGEACAVAAFGFGGGSASRQYDIKIQQFSCAMEDVGGPPGCLQYFMSNTGVVASFNYPIGASTISDTATDGTAVTHLSNQDYDICFRRNSGNCAVCFTPTIDTDPKSFGVSVSINAASKSALGTDCTTDYLLIPLGQAEPTAKTTSTSPTNAPSKFCGRMLNVAEDLAASATVCTGVRPFRINFHTDGTEADGTTDATDNESMVAPGGIIGFSLNFAQAKCS